MSATRTQVYLTERQRQGIDRAAAAEGITMAEVVRRALDQYLAAGEVDPGPALATTFGLLPDLVVPDRAEWNRG